MRLSILSTKGGIGKSTISALLGKFFAEKGQNTLIIDRDPLGWISKLAKIFDKGLLARIVDGDKSPCNCYTEIKLNGKLGILKFYGDGPRFYVDYEIINKNKDLKNKLEEEYRKKVTQDYKYFIVDNPSNVSWEDEEVQLEFPMFKKNPSTRKNF
ncbi:AAA family ATPase [Acidianus sulfidivorans JP7]|uniref:CobQ/CobB/MinD/ParA nucleotide binding domain-containing protein n=1 Tax=Acidianus sulfidivorans JP7 TaxID=619593 RepID=A0A2U9IKZ6_9CREN|nr:AAA family ATPase [Acidianus sulfidivorans]AWR96709.1 AAA family ATPase [Acidianus sulfidivorans JP7]